MFLALDQAKVSEAFLGFFLALLSAGVLWLIKSAYSKHLSEISALSRYERAYVLNISKFRDNMQFVGEWISAARQIRPYSFQFDSFIVNQEDSYQIKNLKLVNVIVSLNYKLNRINLDVENVCKDYWKILERILEIEDQKTQTENLKRYHETIVQTLGQMRENYKSVEKETVTAIASIRVEAEVRKHSIFGYLDSLFIDIWPVYSEDRIKVLVKGLEEEVLRKNSKIVD